jgi:pyruvate/2-oxoacid:ferredoxin oxidoreductase alpha subunit
MTGMKLARKVPCRRLPVLCSYPITHTEVAKRMSVRLPGGDTYIQMEDEIAAMAAVVSASCAAKSATTIRAGFP